MRMVTTGIQGLDAQFGGGIPAGSSILLISEPTNAPHLFCEQFAAGGLDARETVYYYSLERPQSELLPRLRGYLTQPDAEKGLQFFDLYSLKLKDLSPAALKTLGVENHAVNLTQDIGARILKHPKGTPFRVVVESVSESVQAFGGQATLNAVNNVVAEVRAMGGVALFMVVKGEHEPQFETRLRHLVDGVIEFGVERQGFGLYSYMSVTKMRGILDAARLLLYKETERGLWLESTRRVF